MKDTLRKSILALVFCAFAVAAIGTAYADGKDECKGKPKNIIILISDGCGYYHVDSASIYQYGATGTQVYESWPVQAPMATFEGGQGYQPFYAWYNFKYVTIEYTDSAAAATAMSTGYKTYSGSIGMDIDGYPLYHALELAETLGKATGVVTSVEFAHATPAGFVAHNASRNNYSEIANEMIYDSAVDVIMGCGNPGFNNDGEALTTDSSTWQYKYVGGQATWVDLLAGTAASDADGDGVDDTWTLIRTREEFQNLMTGDTPKRIIGVPEVGTTLQQSRGGDGSADPYVVPLIESVPTLAEMTLGALNVLDNDEDGMFLMIEGGAVDWASHANQNGRVIEEEIDFNRAVEAVVEWVETNSSWKETLVIVTGDHECGYLTGPGSGPSASGPTWNPLTNNGAGSTPGMQWNSGDHTNSLIPLYAKGAKANKFDRHKYLSTTADPVRGRFVDNTSISNIIFELWQ